MNTRERIRAVLQYGDYDRLPVLHFGFLGETLARWQGEGHIDLTELGPIGDASPGEEQLSRRLGLGTAPSILAGLCLPSLSDSGTGSRRSSRYWRRDCRNRFTTLFR
jgi:hypothetical protein